MILHVGILHLLEVRAKKKPDKNTKSNVLTKAVIDANLKYEKCHQNINLTSTGFVDKVKWRKKRQLQTSIVIVEIVKRNILSVQLKPFKLDAFH